LIHVGESAVGVSIGLLGVLSSFVADYAMRQRTAKGSMKYFIVRQTAVPRPDHLSAATPWEPTASVAEWLGARVLELTHTSWLTREFACDMGYGEMPFEWSHDRRSTLQCEIDAAVFHLYRLRRLDVEHVMDSFRLVRDSDEAEHGEYRTKRLILEIYDELADAIATGRPYQTRLEPPPADPRVAHPHSTRAEIIA
jgi:hypothetical protein